MKKISSLIIVIAMLICSVSSVGAVDLFQEDKNDFSVSEFNFDTGEEIQRDFKSFVSKGVENKLKESNEKTTITTNYLRSVSEYDRSLNNGSNMMIEDDQRVLVENTEIAPYSSIVYLKINWGLGENDTRATGFLVSDNVVVTAAHALYDPDRGGWPNSVKVFPGKDGDGLLDNPYGSTRSYKCGVSSEYRAAIDSGLEDNETLKLMSESDWGALVLIRSLGKKTGVLNMRIPSDNDLNNISYLTVSGYPRFINNNFEEDVFQQYRMSGTIKRYTDSEIFYYIHTSGGQSGSPILDENNIVIGIHTSGWPQDGTNLFAYGSGVRFTENIMYYLNLTITENS